MNGARGDLPGDAEEVDIEYAEEAPGDQKPTENHVQNCPKNVATRNGRWGCFAVPLKGFI